MLGGVGEGMCVQGQRCVCVYLQGWGASAPSLLISSAHCSNPPAGVKGELYAAATLLDRQGRQATAQVGWQLPAALPAALASLP